MKRMVVLLALAVGVGLAGVGEAKEHGGKEHPGKEHAGRAVPEATAPPGLSKQEKTPTGLEKQHKTPQGWTKGKKTGWKKSPKPVEKPSKPTP